LIKFKTPVKNVTVTTLSEKENGEEMLVMGDTQTRTRSTATETTPAAPSSNAATQVQTVADLKPSEEAVAREMPGSSPPPPPPPPSYETAAELRAEFISDVVADGTKLPSNHVFKQTWTLLNPGPGSWPAGCSVKFVGGDNMLALDPQHVSSLTDLDNASESNTLDRSVLAGERVEFIVSMRTPNREGKCISYWRLTSPSGIKFGHKLWCDVDVCQEVSSKPVETEHTEEARKEEKPSGSEAMIFPKLDKESPVSSQHESAPATTDAGTAFSPLEQLRKEEQDEMLSEVASLDDDDDEDDVSFLTDDEYDVLDASDEDFLTEAQNGLKK
jgi:next-to-BRCA1 protein 1